jgi:hypothetical protein
MQSGPVGPRNPLKLSLNERQARPRSHERTVHEGRGAVGGDSRRHWQEIARQWKHVGPPLRPSKQDLDFCVDTVGQWTLSHGAPRVLLLGVTPELYRLPWPEGTDFIAVDCSRAMIDTAWPGPGGDVQCSDWLTLDMSEKSRDIALCDGGLHLLAYPREQGRLVSALHHVLSDWGLCILRLYVPPPERESPEDVLHDLLESRITNLNILKLRLGMSLMESAGVGVELGKVWSAVHGIAPSLEGLAVKIGWPIDHMLGINAYRRSKAKYHFATVNQVSTLFCGEPGGFEVCCLRVPSYELGDRCPTIVFRRRPDVPSVTDM